MLPILGFNFAKVANAGPHDVANRARDATSAAPAISAGAAKDE
jgi:hypothetical protein